MTLGPVTPQVPKDAPPWAISLLGNIIRWVQALLRGPQPLTSYTVSGAPDATKYTGSEIYVSNESGGAVPAFSDGTNWRRVTDRAIIS